jgi:hypothetical protein
LLHPVYNIQIGSSSIEPDTSDEVTDIAVRLTMDSAPGHFEGRIGIGESPETYSKNDNVVVSLGYRNDDGTPGGLTDVFVGKLDSLETLGSKVLVLSPLTKLYNLYIDRFYEHQSAGAIVKDLANTAGIGIDAVSDGAVLPSYAVGRNKSAFQHISELAELNGFDFYATNKSKIIFKEHIAREPHSLSYGKNIISIETIDQNSTFDSVNVFGSGPSGTKGSGAYYWMSKESVKGTAGDGGNLLLVQNKALRDSDSAKAAAKAKLEELKSIIIVEVVTLGNPKIMLGDSIKIENSPDEFQNGIFQVREIEHYLSKSEGFTTTLTCRGKIK